MRTVKELINPKKKVYIIMRTKEMRFRFMSDAAREGITYEDGVKTTERIVDDIMVLKANGTICFLGFAGRMKYHHNKNQSLCIDYEKYVDGASDYSAE